MARNFKPGQTAPASGQYLQMGPRGGPGKEVTVTKGEPLPPTPTSGGTYKLVDAQRTNRVGANASETACH
ncbi:MAG TPA: YjzC family protein [Phycisphaerae bacterium]|jgi:hypothetical protein|nr:YjzC family protein [Phycisphaerae bacterium]